MIGLHDMIAAELLEKKSLAALIWLIDSGRELEFTVDGTECFISQSNSKLYASLWVNKEQQAFERMEQLVETATIDGTPFLEVWGRAELTTLF